MPYYYRLTNGHGNGAEYVMIAEWYFNLGKFEDSEITVHKAVYFASKHIQLGTMYMCYVFLQVRLALIKGDFAHVHSSITENA